MSIGRSLVIGIATLTVLTVLSITYVLTRNADKMVGKINTQLVEMSGKQKDQLSDMLISEQKELANVLTSQRDQNSKLSGTVASQFGILSQDLEKLTSSMGEKRAELEGKEIGARIQILMDSFVVTAKTLAQALAAYKMSCDKEGISPDRETLDTMLVNVLKVSPGAMAIWNVWGENALDGKDQVYIDAYNKYIAEHDGKVVRGLDALALGPDAMNARP
ncbi:MAG: hypothetical protein ACRC2T_07255, partial [Thermoguttaceae bacterium]